MADEEKEIEKKKRRRRERCMRLHTNMVALLFDVTR